MNSKENKEFQKHKEIKKNDLSVHLEALGHICISSGLTSMEAHEVFEEEIKPLVNLYRSKTMNHIGRNNLNVAGHSPKSENVRNI